MEFRFNLNEIFQDNVVEVDSTLIPPRFKGDKRALWDTQSKIAQIVNAMGEASARAQGLNKPITTSDRLRNSEHKLYLLVDKDANNGKGAVTGMLKMGEKGLYIFDRQGQHYKVSPWCVLDFYVHESRQRSGYGKKLFEHMLQLEKTEPVKLAIDRPSDKFLGFLKKHYSLDAPIKQMNNYVVFDGFFPKGDEDSARQHQRAQEDETEQCTPTKKSSANGLQAFQGSPYGRYGAHRPPCSMGQIIHNDTGVVRNQEPTGSQDPQSQVTQNTPNMNQAFQTQPRYVPQPIPQNQVYMPPEPCHEEIPPKQQIQVQYPLQTQGTSQYQTYECHHPTQNDQSKYQMQFQYQDQVQYPPCAQVTSNQTQLQGLITVQEYEGQPCYEVQPCGNQGQYAQNEQSIFQGQTIQSPPASYYKEPLIVHTNTDRNQQHASQSQIEQIQMYPNTPNAPYAVQNQPQATQSLPHQGYSSQNIPHVSQSMPNQGHQSQVFPNQSHFVPNQGHQNQNYTSNLGNAQYFPNNGMPFQQRQNHDGQNAVSNVENYNVKENDQVLSRPQPSIPNVPPNESNLQLTVTPPSPDNHQVQNNQNQNEPESQNYYQNHGQPQSQNYYQNHGQPQSQYYQNQGQPQSQSNQNQGHLGQPQLQIQPKQLQNAQINQPQSGVYYQHVEHNQVVPQTVVPQRQLVEPLQAHQNVSKDPGAARNVPQSANNAGDAPQTYSNLPLNGMQSVSQIPKNQVLSKSVPNVPNSTSGYQNDLRCASVFPIQAGCIGGVGQNTCAPGHGGQKSILSMPAGSHQRASRVTSGLDVNQKTKNATRIISMNEYQPANINLNRAQIFSQ